MKRLMRNQTNSSRSRQPQAEKFAWRTTALAAALCIMLNMMHTNANALSLGAMTSLSSLGESLAAGIAISEADTKELESLKLSLATPAEYSAMGLDYNSALSSAQITLMRRANGSAYLLIRSDKTVNDPFVNVIVQASWSGGRIVRNYTILIDPPTSNATGTNTITTPLAVTTAPVQVVTPTPIPAPASAPVAVVEATPQVASVTSSPTPAPAATQAPTPLPATKAVATKQASEQVRVKQGDTAGAIAAQNLPVNVSLDQMLVALLRGNPKAFEGNNVNRLKAGAVLELPNVEDASKIEAKEARQNILAQSKDFKTFRRSLADNAAILASKSSDRQSGGKIDAVVDDRKAASTAPDKLTLSKANAKGDVKGIQPDESAKIAKERQVAADKARAAELNKNIADLNAVATAASAAKSGTAKAPETTLTPTVVATAPTSVTTPATASPAAAPAAAQTPAAANATVKPATPLPAPVVPEPNFMDDLLANPMILPATGGLLALLAGWGLYKARQRKNRLEDEDFDDRDDNERTVFNLTQMDDVQANVNINTPVTPTLPVVTSVAKIEDVPSNVDIKLDSSLAAADAVTGSSMRSAATPIPETKPSANQTQNLITAIATAKDSQEDVLANAFPDLTPSEFSVHTIVQVDPVTAKSPTSVDLDLDFDFAVSGFQKLEPEPVKAALFTPPEPVVTPPPVVQKQAETPSLHEKNGMVAAATAASTAAVASVKTANAPMEFNLDGLSLDLNANNKAVETALVDVGPLETKLALANEFRAIGDISGAKVLVLEVIARASGSLKSKAETILSELG